MRLREPSRPRLRRRTFWFAWTACALGAAAWAGIGCNGWDPRDPFQHNSPVVDEAIGALDGGQPETAEELLERYLATGACGDAGIGLPDGVRQKPNGSFDLGLTLFQLAEKYGRRFGDEDGDHDEGIGVDPGARTREMPERAIETACALVIVKAIAEDPRVPLELRARAFYLAGNLEFLNRRYQDAVKEYDLALGITPGLPADAGYDTIGRDAAHNRALALRRLQEQQDAGADGGDDGDGGDGGPGDAGDSGTGPGDAAADGGAGDAGGDGGDDQDPQQQNSGLDAGDGGKDAGPDGSPDAGGDAGEDAGPTPADKGDAGNQPQQQAPTGDDKMKGSSQDDRMLDRLEATPSYQQQDARSRANQRRGHAMEDK